MVADQVAHAAHLNARDTTLSVPAAPGDTAAEEGYKASQAAVRYAGYRWAASRRFRQPAAAAAPCRPALGYKNGWRCWFTITISFATDFGVGEWHGTNVFYRDGDRVFCAYSYFINNRGDEQMGGTGTHLDITPAGCWQ